MESTAAWFGNERIRSQSWLALFAVLGSVATGCGQDADSGTTLMEQGREPEWQRLFADTAELRNVEDVSPLQPVPTYLRAEEVTALMADHTLNMERHFPVASAQVSTKAAVWMFLNYPAGQDVPQTAITTVNAHLCYLHTFSGPIRGGTLMKVGLYAPPIGGIPVSIVVEKDPAPEMGVFCVP